MSKDAKSAEEKGEEGDTSFGGGDYPESEIDAVRVERDVALQQYVSLCINVFLYSGWGG